MKAREYLEQMDKNQQVTFVIAKSVKDERTPFYHYEYKTTPVGAAWEMLRGEWIDKYIVINADHPPIDISGTWGNWYRNGRIKCAMLTTEEDLITHYGENQGRSMIAFYEREVAKQFRQANGAGK